MCHLKILFLAAEAAPLVKIGGLGDVAGSLPGAIKALPGAPDIRIALPYYPHLKELNLALTLVSNFEVSSSQGPIQADRFPDYSCRRYLVFNRWLANC